MVPVPSEQAPVHQLCVDIPGLIARGPGPYAMEIPIAANWIAKALEETDAEVSEPGSLTGELSFQGKTALVRGQLSATFHVPCARCLGAAPVDGGGEFCVHFERGASQRPKRVDDDDDDDGEEIDPGSPEEFTFDGITLDLRPVLIEHFVMAYPMRTLCAQGEACRGLCSGCGANLNAQEPGSEGCTACVAQVEEAASSEAPAGNPDWQAALQKLRNKT